MIRLFPWISLKAKLQTLILKSTLPGDVQFMSWMKYCNEKYLYYPIGNPAHVQGYILVTNNFMQDQYLYF